MQRRFLSATGTPPSASPTGIVFNPSGSAFPLLGTGGKPAIFIFDAEDGAISGWNPTVDLTHAKTAKDNSGSGAVYKGLAIGTRSNGSLAIYATNFHAGTVDAFDSSFNPITGGFVDPSVPTGYAPFGIANIDNKIYVTFALQNDEKHDDVAGKDHGFVDVFSADGVFIRRLIPFNDMTGPLNSPWGLARVPQEFREFPHNGEFRHKFGGFGDNVLLVGNFGDGKINAFDIRTGTGSSLIKKPPRQEPKTEIQLNAKPSCWVLSQLPLCYPNKRLPDPDSNLSGSAPNSRPNFSFLAEGSSCRPTYRFKSKYFDDFPEFLQRVPGSEQTLSASKKPDQGYLENQP